MFTIYQRYNFESKSQLLKTYNSAFEIGGVKKAIADENDSFFFSNNDTANRVINKQLSIMAKQMDYQLLNSVEKSWKQGKENVSDRLQTISPKDKDEQKAFDQIRKAAEESNRANAAQAFYNEKRGGFSISERVWNLAGNAKKEIEIILQNGIKEGKSADDIQKSLKGYLNEPDKLFRRVLNKKTGNLEWSKAAQKYHPGKGVYRSAYKNMMRLVRTELKAANCEAVWQSMQNNPIITGYKVVLSNNHTTLSNGKKIPLKDICDELQGVYPKTFKFKGWHPQCRCEMLPIMATSDERKDLYKKIFDNKRDKWRPKQINNVPDGFKNWVEANKQRQNNGGNMPYFVRDNFKDGLLSNGLRTETIKAEPIIEPIQSTPLDDVIVKLSNNKVEYNEVAKLDKPLTDEEIISRVGGGDITSGSCASLGLAYAANKGGLDVLDFRGGKSLDYFCKTSNLHEIARKIGGISEIGITGMQLLKNVEVGKQYYLAIARHAAIVRKVAGKYQYLELQSDNNNGWHDLNSKVFSWRFSARGKCHGLLMDIEILQKDSGFKKMVGYINTAESEQKKGRGGTIK